MGINRDKNSRCNKKTKTEMGINRQKEEMEHEDRVAASYK